MKYRIGLLLFLLLSSTSVLAIEVKGKFSLKSKVKELLDQRIPQDFFEKMASTEQPFGIESDDLPFPPMGAKPTQSLDSLIAYIDKYKDDSDKISLSSRSFFRFSPPLDNLVIENIQWTLRQKGIYDLDRQMDPHADLSSLYEDAIGANTSPKREKLLRNLVRLGILDAVSELRKQLAEFYGENRDSNQRRFRYFSLGRLLSR